MKSSTAVCCLMVTCGVYCASAGQVRAYARMQYQKATGNTFSPSNSPSSGTSARDSWDSCKRIYDIFGK